MPISRSSSHRTRRGPIGLLATALTVLLLATACSSSGGDTADAGSDTTAGAEGSAFPVTVEHKYGTTTVESEPQRVVSVGYTDQDPLLALGVVPVGIRDWFGDQPSATWPWAQDLLDGEEPTVLGASDLSLEQVAALDPDLIVGVSSGMTSEQYELLSEIAPTIAQTADAPDYQETWQTGTRLIAAAVGRTDEAEELITEVEALFAEARQANPEFEGQEGTVSYVMSEGEVGAYASGDSRSRILTDLGFVIPPEIDDLAGEQFYSSFSLEEIGQLDRDLLVWITYDPAIVEQLKASPVRQTLDVATDGREVFMSETEAAASSFSSVLSLPVLLETFVPKLQAALDGDPTTSAQ